MIRTILYCALLAVLSLSSAEAQVRTGIFITDQEAADIRASLGQYPLLDAAYDHAREIVESGILQGVDVPQPGEAGGPEHRRHQQNYREMYNAGLLHAITGEQRYADHVAAILDGYADLYPTLGPHPLSHHQLPGKIFHQILNDNVWLVHTSIAYDAVYGSLTPEQRRRYESNVFRPMVAWLAREENHYEWNRIHNHGTWTVAAAGMMSYVLEDQETVDKALLGSDLSGEGGFLPQLDLLFSPDGWYEEGPYYIRYAMMPFVFFAEAIERIEPERQIFSHRDGILRKAVSAAVQSAFPNGVFPPINNASKSMDVVAPEVILGVDVMFDRFGEEALLGVKTLQERVILNGSGLATARAHAAANPVPQMTWQSVEFSDGPDGNQGGHGILRTGEGLDQTMLLMKYGVHGGGHGHFDKLHFIFFDQGREVVPDYGFGRWINTEPKWGGRYLPEGRSYAPATVAHNTVVVDGRAQNDFNRGQADEVSGTRHFFETADSAVQAMSARADDAYPGIRMQRTMLLLTDEAFEYPVVVDLYRLESSQTHQYDFPIHYYGQPILTNFEYERPAELRPLGDDHGYQHLWLEGAGRTDEGVQFTWLDGSRYYTLTSSAHPDTEVIFARIGANDPDFNLRSEPAIMLRRTDGTHLFASVIEPHGYFNEAREISRDARPRVERVEVLGHSDKASVVRLEGAGSRWDIVVNNGAASEERREVSVGGVNYELDGNITVTRTAL